MGKYDPYINSERVSVIIPCYNHAHYLPVAIESVLNQSHSNVEIIVVDDGSTDNTKQVAQSYPEVKYIWQQNHGLPASRNTGIKNCTGAFVVFLDADDWLYTDAIKINLHHLRQNDPLAFVSGAYEEVKDANKIISICKNEITSNHYQQLLFSNYVGMISTVLYRRWVFDEVLFDENLKACEDYDLYLKITRKYPVLHHTEIIAAYRRHQSNMSLDFPLMLSSSLNVLQQQRAELKTVHEVEAYKKGQRFWKKYYAQKTYHKARMAKKGFTKQDLTFLLKNSPFLFFKFIIVHPLRKIIGNKLQFSDSKRKYL